MAIHTTRWSLDTCDCQVEYQWDDTTSESNRTHSISNILKSCAAHQAIANTGGGGDIASLWNVLMEENPRKNIALDVALTNGPNTLYDVQPDGSRQLKKTVGYNWSWSGTAPNRVLTISFVGVTLTTAQKSALQNAVDARFGAGKIVVA